MSENSPEKSESNGHPSHGRKALAHILPVWMLLLIWALLIVLTVATVAASRFNFGSLNLYVALGIAIIKATLVAMYYMHLRYEKPLLALILICSLVFFMLFTAITLLDSQAYAPNLIEGYAPMIPR